jgi:hypothetical protein
VPSSPVVDGLIAWYRFEDSSTTAIDATNALGVGADQTAFDGTVSGASFVPNGGVRDVVSGQNPSGAYDLDGTDDNISVPGGLSIQQDWTITTWINTGSVSTTQVLVTATNVGNVIGVSGGGDLAAFYMNSNVSSGVSIPTNAFTHLAIKNINQSKTVEFYINGSQVATESFSSYQGSGDVSILGSSNGAFFTDGVLDDMRFFRQTKSAAEINQIFINTDPS